MRCRRPGQRERLGQRARRPLRITGRPRHEQLIEDQQARRMSLRARNRLRVQHRAGPYAHPDNRCQL
jgi:hypothetical protein